MSPGRPRICKKYALGKNPPVGYTWLVTRSGPSPQHLWKGERRKAGMDIAQLKNRDIHLWGARQLGLSLFEALDRQGLTPTAFLDSSRALQGRRVLGRPVLAPETLLDRPAGAEGRPFFIVITSGFYYPEIAERCRAAGLADGQDFIAAAELQRFDYQIDVAGTCNLRCLSCPRGNFHPQPAKGFMSPDSFARVLDKIRRDDPFVGAVALYNFGEPLLHPDLPEIIGLARAAGVRTAVSSNLNFRLDFAPAVAAGPAWFRVSTSGWGDSYEVTHTGGRWPLFLKNLRRLRDLRAEHAPDMDVEVFYHIYRDRHDDFRKMRDLCAELDFTLRLRHAALAPLDLVMEVAKGRPLPPEAEATRRLQTLPIDEALELAREQRHLPCPYQRCLWITWDRRVRQCMEWFGPDLDLFPDFLETPLDGIAAAREDRGLCRRCQAEALHRCYLIYGDESLIEKRGTLAAAGGSGL